SLRRGPFRAGSASRHGGPAARATRGSSWRPASGPSSVHGGVRRLRHSEVPWRFRKKETGSVAVSLELSNPDAHARQTSERPTRRRRSLFLVRAFERNSRSAAAHAARIHSGRDAAEQEEDDGEEEPPPRSAPLAIGRGRDGREKSFFPLRR